MLRVFVCVCLSVCFVSYCQVIIFSAEKTNRDANEVGDERSRRASIFLPINCSKIITTVPGSMCRNALGVGWFDRSPGIVARVSSWLVYTENKAPLTNFNTII